MILLTKNKVLKILDKYYEEIKNILKEERY